VKENGKLLADLDAPRKAVEASRDYLVGQVEPQEGWLVAARA
jgi:hypothetical protein